MLVRLLRPQPAGKDASVHNPEHDALMQAIHCAELEARLAAVCEERDWLRAFIIAHYVGKP